MFTGDDSDLNRILEQHDNNAGAAAVPTFTLIDMQAQLEQGQVGVFDLAARVPGSTRTPIDIYWTIEPGQSLMTIVQHLQEATGFPAEALILKTAEDMVLSDMSIPLEDMSGKCIKLVS